MIVERAGSGERPAPAAMVQGSRGGILLRSSNTTSWVTQGKLPQPASLQVSHVHVTVAPGRGWLAAIKATP